jgi:hypothetical protein
MCQFFGTLCSIFIGGVSRKNSRDEIAGVFTQVSVWLKNSLSQSEGGVTGRERVLVEEEAVGGKDPQVEACRKTRV